MKNLLVLIITIGLFCSAINCFAQPTTEAEGKEMAQKLMKMTPAQIMKFRDSMMKAVMQKQAKALPNGNQLLMEHHYDTTYTTVRFNYTMNSSQHTTKSGGHSTIIIYGKSAKAAVLYEANGHTIVTCGLNMPGANTTQMDKSATGINKNLKYMTPKQQADAINMARQTSFGSMSVNNNSLTGSASENGLYSGEGGNTIITTKPPLINMAFTFIYDPVEGLSTVAAGGQYNRHTVSNSLDQFQHISTKVTDDVAGAGMGAATDPTLSHMAGAATPRQSDPNEAYIKVTKTARGFSVKWTKHTTQPDVNGVTDETFNADIGEPDQQYEAIIHPMPDSKYETWLPKGAKVDGADDLKGDDSARFYVEVHDKSNPNKMYAGNYTVKYQLKDITHYKGITSNYPVFVAHAEPDFKISDSIKYFSPGTFDPASVTDSTATSQPNKGNLAILRLMCLDYGAWTKLTAEVTLDDGSVITANPYYDKGETFITIPFDRDENKIADAWEKYENIFGKGYGLDWDEDVKPDNHHNGDNIPLIDEYRGFLTEDDNYKPVYKRFSPQVKELITIAVADNGGVNETYKAAIKTGALGYGKASGVKIYHLTNSKYGQREMGEPGGVLYGRWVNYNSPLQIYTRGVTIAAHAEANPDPDPDVALAIATTFPISGAPHAGVGAMLPEETKGISVWVKNIVDGSYKPEEYLPLNGHPDDPNVIRKNTYVTQANAEFHVNIDPLHMSDIVAQYHDVNIGRVISFALSHELCHATNIHHHHVTSHEANPYFLGASTCPVRYWMNNHVAVNGCTWVVMFITGKWNPATLTTPWGPGDQMRLCTVGDNCFSQLQLKKN